MTASLMGMLGYYVYLKMISADVLVAIASMAVAFYFKDKEE
jgi:hypothetical protein